MTIGVPLLSTGLMIVTMNRTQTCKKIGERVSAIATFPHRPSPQEPRLRLHIPTIAGVSITADHSN